MKLAFLLLLAAANLGSAAEPMAFMPYEKLYALFHDAAGVTGPHLRTVVRINSTNKEVKPAQIALAIQAKSGPITLALESDGELHDFPMWPELLKENPLVTTDQPKGTLRITPALEIKLPDSASYTATQLNGFLQEANAALKKQAGGYSALAPQGAGLVFEFREAGEQTATVGPKTLRAAADGKITLLLDKQTLADNPTVTLSEKPARASLDFRKRN